MLKQKKKILVTGAAGFIGCQLLQKLAGISEYSVTGIDLNRPAFTLPQNIAFRQMDIRSEKLVTLVRLEQFDLVVHLACIVTPPAKMSRQTIYEIDVVATERLLKGCVETGVQKFIITSSGAAYGYHADNPVPLSESDPLRGNQDFAYSHHKRLVEKILAEFRKQCSQLNQLILRPGTVLGKTVKNQITNLFNQPVLTTLRGYDSPFVFIWDVDLVHYILEGIRSDVCGEFNIAGDGTLTMRQIAKKIGRPCIPLPVGLLKAFLSFLKPLGITRYRPEQIKFVQFRPVLDNRLAKAIFEYQPTYTTEQAFDAYWQANLLSKN